MAEPTHRAKAKDLMRQMPADERADLRRHTLRVLALIDEVEVEEVDKSLHLAHREAVAAIHRAQQQPAAR